MIIRRPTEKDLPRLSQIWQQAFGDGAEDVEHFYTTAFCYDRCLVAVHQTAVACIYWMDAQMAGRKIAYLYAFGVDAPWFSYEFGIGALLSADISDEDIRNILYRNPLRIMKEAHIEIPESLKKFANE